ncbi:MAG: hypothetical protein U0324_04625 [Polyangiales bacterium]
MRRALLLPALALGCASAGAPPPSAAPSSAYSTQSTREVPASYSATPRTGASQGYIAPSIPSVQPTAPEGPDFVPPTDEEQREADIARWQERLHNASNGLAATVSECRSICMAASDVCTAAREICRLTGDLVAAQARDARCGRARASCIDAGRRRDGACPVCPPR